MEIAAVYRPVQSQRIQSHAHLNAGHCPRNLILTQAIAAAGKGETSYIVWHCIEDSLVALDRAFTGMKIHSSFKAFAAGLR